MYADSTGKRRFSFQRFASNVAPNFPNTDARLTELSTQQQDNLFVFQAGLSRAKVLDELVFYIVGIVTREAASRKIHEALLKIGVLSDAGAAVHTDRITKNFAHQMYMITSHQQKMLVNLLFAWEEELVRWRLIEEERDEILAVMEAERTSGEGGFRGDLEKRLKELEGLWKLKPSMRAMRDRGVDVLPSYVAEEDEPPAGLRN
jgi:hypothetical protein